MLTSTQITSLFNELSDELQKRGIKGEVGIVGGAVMCLVFNARQATRDIDAIFEPTQEIRGIVRALGKQHQIGPDWLNDAAKGLYSRNF